MTAITTTTDGFTVGHTLYGSTKHESVTVGVIVCETCGCLVVKCDVHRTICPAPEVKP